MIELQLLGGAGVDAPGLSVNARARRRHPLALLALTVAAQPHPLPRDRAMALLWPESDADRASNSLRQVLVWLRRDLGEEIFLPHAAGGLLLDAGIIRSDVEQFHDALASGMPEAAVQLYRGPFLDGFHLPDAPEFEQWLETERERLRRQYLASLVKLAKSAEEEGRLTETVAWRRRQAAADPFSSRAALSLLEALTIAGDRPGALEYAAIHEHLVREHLDTEPDPAVAVFVGRLRDPAFVAPSPAPEAEATPALQDATATAVTVPDEGPVSPVRPPPAEFPRAPASRRPRRVLRVAIVAVGLAVGVLAFAVPFVVQWPFSETHGPIVLASGTSQVNARDPNTLLVACEGPACPLGSLPQNAFLVPKHVSYAAAGAGTGFIAPVQDGSTAGVPGYPCCTTAVFEQVFDIPAGATDPHISVTVLADNQASVSINGVDIGQQAEPLRAENYAGPPATFRTVFAPTVDGPNRLRVTLWDGGGSLGLHFHAVVKFDVKN